MRGELSGCSEDMKEMVLLLLSFFDDKEDVFCNVEDTFLAEEMQMDQVRLIPTIVVCGKSNCFHSCLLSFEFLKFFLHFGQCPSLLVFWNSHYQLL